MPVVPDAIIGTVLTHGRNHDPVGKLDTCEPNGGKQSTGHVACVAGRGLKGEQDRDLLHRGKQLTASPIPFCEQTSVKAARDEIEIGRLRRSAPIHAGIATGLLPRGCPHGRRCDLGPSFACSNGFPHALQEFLLGVVTLPAPAMIKLDKVRAPLLRESAPLPCHFVECRRGEPFRHENAVASCGLAMRDRLVNGMHTQR